MRNIDKYEKEIRKVIESRTSIAVDKRTNKVCPCRGKACMECLFFMNVAYSSNCPAAKLGWLLEEYKEPSILDKTEKRYLENIIRPFKNRVISITKRCIDEGSKEEYIEIRTRDHRNKNLVDNVDLPYFDLNKMYKGMKRKTSYTIKELGLFEDEKCKEQ